MSEFYEVNVLEKAAVRAEAAAALMAAGDMALAGIRLEMLAGDLRREAKELETCMISKTKRKD